MKKIIILFLVCFFGFLPYLTPVSAETKQVTVYFFWGDGCPHCAKEKPFLENLQKINPSLKIKSYEVWYEKKNQKLLQQAGKALNAKIAGVPFTVIGEKYITGYQEDETTGNEIKKAIDYCSNNTCKDPLAEVITQIENQQVVENPSFQQNSVPDQLNFPFIGKVKPKDFSLPVITILIAALDGFNPCAMWTLLFLISLLIGMHDRKKMWVLGSTFIIASAMVYFFFMAAWLNLILFIGYIFWIRLIIGLIAVGGGLYNLREYIVNKNASCKVTRSGERRKVFETLRNLTKEKNFLLAFIGIILLAAAVNLIELVCSAGLPVVFTQILAINHLPMWQYVLYMLLYIGIFMLDDLFVFIVSMKTLEVTGVTTKYSHFSHLIGGILMLVIGLILLLKPELLMFG